MTSGSARPRNRRLPVSPLAIGLAVLLHGVLFSIMFIKVDSHVKQVAAVKSLQIKADKPLDIIEATAIDNKVLEEKKEKKRAIEREKQRKLAAEKKRLAEKERKRKAEVKRKKEEQVKKKKAEEKRKKELAIKKAEAKKKAAEEKKKADKERARKKAEAKKKKEAERKKKLAEEKKRKADAERKRKEDAMRKQMEAKARAARAGQAMSKYVPRIQAKVESNWSYPPQGPEGCNPTVRVNLAPNGKVLNVKIVKSSGDPYCDSSVKKAFLKASPIPIPLDPDLYSEFKTIDFPFRP